MKNSRFNKSQPNKHGQNGKGDRNRTSKHEQFKKNYDKINWHKPTGKSAPSD